MRTVVWGAYVYEVSDELKKWGWELPNSAPECVEIGVGSSHPHFFNSSPVPDAPRFPIRCLLKFVGSPSSFVIRTSFVIALRYSHSEPSVFELQLRDLVILQLGILSQRFPD